MLSGPEKSFYAAGQHQICDDMKKVTLDKIISVLEQDDEGLIMSADFMDKANAPLKRMLELSRLRHHEQGLRGGTS